MPFFYYLFFFPLSVFFFLLDLIKGNIIDFFDLIVDFACLCGRSDDFQCVSFFFAWFWLYTLRNTSPVHNPIHT